MAKYKIIINSADEFILEGNNIFFDITNKLLSVGIQKKEFCFTHKTNDLVSDNLLYNFQEKIINYINNNNKVEIFLVGKTRESKILELLNLTSLDYIATPIQEEDKNEDYDFRETLSLG